MPGKSPASKGFPSSNNRSINETIATGMGAYPVPEGLRWDLYLGPVAEDIAYHPVYHPFNWRGWLDFGGGALGDMGAHLLDHPYWALGLTQPTSIEATSTAFGMATLAPLNSTAAANTPEGRPRQVPASYPLATTVHYQFPARGRMPAVKLNWFDGGLYPPRPDVLPDAEVLTGEGGVIFYGEEGILMNDTYGANPRCYPQGIADAAARVPKTMLLGARILPGRGALHARAPPRVIGRDDGDEIGLPRTSRRADAHLR